MNVPSDISTFVYGAISGLRTCQPEESAVNHEAAEPECPSYRADFCLVEQQFILASQRNLSLAQCAQLCADEGAACAAWTWTGESSVVAGCATCTEFYNSANNMPGAISGIRNRVLRYYPNQPSRSL